MFNPTLIVLHYFNKIYLTTNPFVREHLKSQIFFWTHTRNAALVLYKLDNTV